jgi:hypothetical protein
MNSKEFSQREINDWYKAYERVVAPGANYSERDITLAVIPRHKLERFYVSHAAGHVDMALLKEFETFLEEKIEAIIENTYQALDAEGERTDEWFEMITHPQGGHAQYSEALGGLLGLFHKLKDATAQSDKVVAFDNIVNWVHGSGGVAKWFIEGGFTTLNRIFSDNNLLNLHRDERNPRKYEKGWYYHGTGSDRKPAILQHGFKGSQVWVTPDRAEAQEYAGMAPSSLGSPAGAVVRCRVKKGAKQDMDYAFKPSDVIPVDNPTLFDEDYKGPRWTYGLTYRPATGRNIPDGFIIWSNRPHPKYAHGTIDYPRELTQHEVDAFELELVTRANPLFKSSAPSSAITAVRAGRLVPERAVRNPMTIDDRRWVTDVLMPMFHIPALRFAWSTSTKRWPDLWIELSGIPRVTITREWCRQPLHERRKRLVHELVGHLAFGWGHMEKKGFSTYPAKDTISMAIYRDILKGTVKQPREYLK